jgi:polygalacturonase
MPLIFPAALHFFVLLRTAAAAGAPHVCTAVCDRHGSNESTVQTSCLQSALDRCHLLASTAGVPAVLLLPAGTYHTGSIVVPSNTTLRMASGATLLGSTDSADYPLVEALPGYGVPRDCCCNDWDRYNCSGLGVGVPPAYIQRHRALLTTVRGATDVAIEGAGGQSSVVDGQGWPWWWKFEQLGLTAGRPHLVEPMFVTGFRIEGIWLKDSPFWTLHPYACDDVVIRNMIITADTKRGHNTDGIDPDSCSRVLVEGCYVRVGDDAVAIKSGIDYAGRRFGRPSQHMLFRNCTFASKHVSIGSEESGGVRNITVEDCILGAPSGPHNSAPFDGFSPGIHLKAERGRGGFIRDITLRRLSFLGPVSQPLFVSMFYSDARNRTNATATPQVRKHTRRKGPSAWHPLDHMHSPPLPTLSAHVWPWMGASPRCSSQTSRWRISSCTRRWSPTGFGPVMMVPVIIMRQRTGGRGR